MLEAGQNLGHFTIIRRLGAGGMGEVYLAEDQKLKRQVALKILQADYLQDTERRERFNREARTAAGISHPNVTGIHDIGTATDPRTNQELTYIVMEYIEGQSITDYVAKTGNDLKVLIRLFEKIASGLAAAHNINVVHRDIKPDNIIVDNQDNPKILDFGLAKPVTPVQMDKEESNDTVSQELTKAGKIVGTVTYMSPEQIRGEAIDTRSDIFSFGILMYRLAAGAPPFSGETQVSTLAKILEAPHEPLHIKNNQIPAELERIIDKCLQKNPNDRYQNTQDLVIDLRNLRRQFDSGISTSRTSGVYNVPQASKSITFKAGWKTLTLALVVIIILAGVFWQVVGDSDTTSGPLVFAGENGLAILDFENKTGNADLAWLETGLPEILQTDLAENNAITIISRDRVIDFIKDKEKQEDNTTPNHEACLKAAGKLGAKHAISGAFYKVDDKIRIDARLEELKTGKIIFAQKVIGSEPFDLVDSLTAKIAQSLNISGESSADPDVATFTTSSTEAYKEYLKAMEYFSDELQDEAIAGFKKALEYDSTFALPYMRIGMAYIFQGRQQEGAQYIAKAEQFEDKLPSKYRNLIDIYGDLWLRRKIDDAFIKMETLVKNHPDDAESRTIYGLLIYAIQGDTVRAFAQLDTALMINPGYMFALTQYATIYGNLEKDDEAIFYALQARKLHPNSPGTIQELANLYYARNDFDNAEREYKDLYARFPEKTEALTRLASISIHRRDFNKAQEYYEQYRKAIKDDPYELKNYHDNMANVYVWQGQFKKAFKELHESLNAILNTPDSQLIAGAYMALDSYYEKFDMPDSELYYAKKCNEWATLFQKSQYPITVVKVDPSRAEEVRPIIDASMKEFRRSLPEDFWPLADALEAMFESYIKSDTVGLIEAYLLIDKTASGNTGNKRMAAYLMAKSGRYQEAIDILSNFVEGRNTVASGFAYNACRYYMGLAYEGLGQTDKAIENYRDMLKYWGKPDYPLDYISDAKDRLNRLTS